ncbi:amino acid permease [Ligilactobacillus salitolerans]|uniref:Amino acid permease n=1 Tax=Ligilactobacillus salitolerans TaxID=1808352 RepID=A0A401IPY2_9LACO|nr:glutamate/gamma-aminobutyrate family transporter YjeM [Ligilactobacillus salitolerans]GBG93598.1 amino acid permease [Ligilactobacillus salitolerans]
MEKTKKIRTGGLVMMTFSSIFGFANTTVAYYQMGYASIFWYILAALLFFLPSSLMFAEYGSAFKEAKGGIYSWLAGSIGEKAAFIGTFIWLSSWIVWLVSTSSKVWIPLSAMIFGHDATQTWSLFGLNATQTIGLLGIIWILFVTYTTTHGMNFIAKISSLGGMCIVILDALFLVASLVVWIGNGGALAEPLHGAGSFFSSPNPGFGSSMALISFVIYAVFAYGGMESMGGIMDDIDRPEKTFPKALVISTIFITVGYALMIFFWGISTNWKAVLSGFEVNLGNITYILMNNLGVQLGSALGLSHATGIVLGGIMTRFAGIGMFMGYLGAFFVLVYSPIKSFILGSDPRLWPAKITKMNKHNMPANAMWLQMGIVALFIFLVAFGGSAAQKFYTILTDMANVSTTFPYLFLVGAFPFFKKRTDLNRPYEIFTNSKWTNLIVALILVVLVGGIGFTCVEPLMEHDYQTAFWTIIGPVFFGLVAWVFYFFAEKRINGEPSSLAQKTPVK